jgi:hypothetical protein
MPLILEGGVQVELKPDLDDAASTIIHIVRVMIETDPAPDDHLPQRLLGGEGSIESKRDRHAQLLMINSLSR